MTNYTTEDSTTDWEFKIVRSEYGAFRKPDVFQQLLQEEAAAGWELVEKLDDRRVRFKRSKEARSKDAGFPAGIDPYRSQFENGTTRTLARVLLGLGLMVVLGAGIIFFVLPMGSASSGMVLILAIVFLIVLLICGVVITLRS